MMWRLYREAWFVGNITKYVLRFRSKNGVQDLEKAAHYLQKLIELEKTDQANQQRIKATNPYTEGLMLDHNPDKYSDERAAGENRDRAAEAKAVRDKLDNCSCDEDRGKVCENCVRLLMKLAELESKECNLPPKGWFCTRAGGHDGPCAVHKHPIGHPDHPDYTPLRK